MKLMCKKKTSVRQQMLFHRSVWSVSSPRVDVVSGVFAGGIWAWRTARLFGRRPSSAGWQMFDWQRGWKHQRSSDAFHASLSPSHYLTERRTDGFPFLSLVLFVMLFQNRSWVTCLQIEEQINWCGLFRMETKLGFVQQKLFLKWWRIHWCCFTALIYRRL